jgi:apolipoprotein D and lipocalin family protein
MRVLASHMFVAALLLLAGCVAGPVGNANVPQPAKPVDLSRYLGVWYEIARYENSFERGCTNVTAEYRARTDGLVDVINTCRRSPTGELSVARGRARVVPGSGNAKFKVSFFGPFFFGDYWVLDHAADYSWSIVGEPSGRFLWILSRQKSPAPAKLAVLRSRVAGLGYERKLLRSTPQLQVPRARGRRRQH